MPWNDFPHPRDPFGRISRRGFLRGAAALTVTRSSLALTQGQANSLTGSILAYVGTYSSPQGPEGSKGNGQGIYLFQMDPSTRALSKCGLFADGSNPSWLAFDPSRTHLYAANETATFQGINSGSVSAFSIDRSIGQEAIIRAASTSIPQAISSTCAIREATPSPLSASTGKPATSPSPANTLRWVPRRSSSSSSSMELRFLAGRTWR